MNQQALFHETVFDALGADISASGGFKVVAGKLWPTESPTTAAAKLRNAINPEQPHKLSPDEVLAIKRLAKEHGSFATVNFEAQELGYTPTWIDPENEIASLMNSVAGDMERIEARQRRIEQLLQRMSDTKLRAVK